MTCCESPSSALQDSSISMVKHLSPPDDHPVSIISTSNSLRALLDEVLMSRFMTKEKPFFESFLSVSRPEATKPAYFALFLELVKDLLRLPQQLNDNDSQQRQQVITQLNEATQLTELLENLEELETQNPLFLNNTSYRHAMIKIMSSKFRTVDEVISSLADVIERALRQFAEVMNKHLEFLPLPTEKIFKEKEEDSATTAPPFFTWGCLQPRLTEGPKEVKVAVPSKRFELEYLFTILQDIERSVSGRLRVAYEHMQEVDLQSLETATSNSRATTEDEQRQALLAHIHTKYQLASLDPIFEEVQESPEPWPLPEEVIGCFSDEMLALQVREMLEAVEGILEAVKSFLALFLPRGYQHRLVKKVWGALSNILHVSCPHFNSSRRAKSLKNHTSMMGVEDSCQSISEAQQTYSQCCR